MCSHLGALVYISKTMASVHPSWLSVISSSSPRSPQLLWHPQFHKHKSLSVDPLWMASINPHLGHTEAARRHFSYSNWYSLDFPWKLHVLIILSGITIPCYGEFALHWYGSVTTKGTIDHTTCSCLVAISLKQLKEFTWLAKSCQYFITATWVEERWNGEREGEKR